MSEKQLLCLIVAGVFDIAGTLNYSNDFRGSALMCAITTFVFLGYAFFIK